MLGIWYRGWWSMKLIACRNGVMTSARIIRSSAKCAINWSLMSLLCFSPPLRRLGFETISWFKWNSAVRLTRAITEATHSILSRISLIIDIIWAPLLWQRLQGSVTFSCRALTERIFNIRFFYQICIDYFSLVYILWVINHNYEYFYRTYC